MINKVGGYWVDTDFVCIKNFNFSHQDIVIVSEPSEDYTARICNFMYD